MNEPKKNTPIGQGNSNLTHNQTARILPTRANPSYSESIKRYYVTEIRSLMRKNKNMPVSEAFLMASRKMADPNPPDIETIYRWIKEPCSVKIDSIGRVEWTHQNDSLPAPLSGAPLESILSYSEFLGTILHALKYGIATNTAHLILFQDTHSQAIIDFEIGMYQCMDASFLSGLHRIACGGPGSLGKSSELYNNCPARPMINSLFVLPSPAYMHRRVSESCNEAFISLHRHRGVYHSRACKIVIEIDRLLKRLAKGLPKGCAKVIMSIEQLEKIVRDVINEYNNRYQTRLNASPAQIFQNSIGGIVSQSISSFSYDPDQAFSIRERRRLTRRGIEYCGLYYNSRRLYLEYKKNISKHVTIGVMPWDLSKIFVLTKKGPLKVPAINVFYAEGLSLDQHFAIRKVCLKGSHKAQFNPSVQQKNSGSPTTGSLIPFPNNP